VRRAAWRQPSRSPRQSPSAVNVMACSFPGSAAPPRPLGPPQPVQLPRQRSAAVLQVLQLAVAVERAAADQARPAAPVAGLRRARTGVVGPGPAGAPAALADPRSGRDADRPGPAHHLAAHQASPPLACCQAPTNPASRRERPGRSRIARARRTPRRGARRARSGPDHATHAGVTAAGSSALAGMVASRSIGTHRPLRPRRGAAAWHTQRGSCRSRREGPGGPGEGSGEPCRSGRS
jgi:hypothetical protein